MQTPIGGTTAASKHRQKDYDRFLNGLGMDIGCGSDPLELIGRHIECWDQADGDAQEIKLIPDERCDFVYSSHCLEHMRDVQETLKNWSRIHWN